MNMDISINFKESEILLDLLQNITTKLDG